MNLNPSRLLDWSGRTCVVLASGPSLASAPVDSLRGRVLVMTVNSTWRKAHWADAIYACDFNWWKVNHADLQACKLIPRCWTQDRSAAERFHLNFVRQAARPGLGKTVVQVNGNGGFGAVNLAYLFGSRRILLLGFDMRLGPKGQRHWHPDHPAPLVQKQQFGEWLHKSEVFARELKDAGCSVINCTPGSALTCFKTATIEEALG